MKFFDYYGNIDEIDPSRSREENLERLRQALRVWRKRQGDRARLTENYINRALEVFSDPKEYEKFRKDWEEEKAKTAKASPEEEFRQLVYGAAIDGEVTTTEYQMLLGEAKRRGIPKGDAERIIQQTVHAHGVPIGQVETRSSEVPAPEVKPNQFRRKWLAGVAATIFGLSFLLFRWALTIYLSLSPNVPPTPPTPWVNSILALGAIVLLVSFVVGSYPWAMIFGVCFCAGYFGMLPHPEVGIGGALITALVGGPMAGGICCLPARLGKRIGTKKRLLIGLGVAIAIVIIALVRVLEV